MSRKELTATFCAEAAPLEDEGSPDPCLNSYPRSRCLPQPSADSHRDGHTSADTATPAPTPTPTATPAPTPTPTATPAPTPTPTATRVPTPTPTQIAGRADLYEDIAVPDHLAYAWWGWDEGGPFGELVFDFTVHTDPGDFSDRHGLYLMVCFGRIAGHGFYFGLQTDVYDPNQGKGRGKGLIFSRWGERDLGLTRAPTEGWGQSSGHEGDFIGVRRSYDWSVGDYRMRLASDGQDRDGVWYGVWITAVHTGDTTWAGSLKFPRAGGIEPAVYSTLEVYGNARIRPIDIPLWHVSMKQPKGAGVKASRAKLGYSGVVGSPVSNADVHHDRETGAVDFRVGGTTERTGAASTVEFQAWIVLAVVGLRRRQRGALR